VRLTRPPLRMPWRTLLLAGFLVPCLGIAQVPLRVQQLVAAANVLGMQRPDFREYQSSVVEFYRASGYAPAWLRGNAPSPQALAMIRRFRDAWKKGLESEDYDGSRWEGRTRSLERPDADVATFDVALTVSAMRYVSDLRIGRINPRHVNFGLSVEQKKYDLAQFLRDRVLRASDPGTVLAAVEPPFAGYQRTEAALVRYMELAKQSDDGKLPVPATPVKPGQSYDGLARLARFLRLVGDLPSGPDGAETPQVYDGELIEAVKRFQRRHGLDADGVLGPATVQVLNVPLAERVRQLQLTLGATGDAIRPRQHHGEARAAD
jgi:L,D-transpeptidase YcbB